ncbi:hypothetical protein KLK36_05580 [Vibrio anguillarum]|nr:hypothetical protein KLK36_05580 [Vibrio anguillarum]
MVIVIKILVEAYYFFNGQILSGSAVAYKIEMLLFRCLKKGVSVAYDWKVIDRTQHSKCENRNNEAAQ